VNENGNGSTLEPRAAYMAAASDVVDLEELRASIRSTVEAAVATYGSDPLHLGERVLAALTLPEDPTPTERRRSGIRRSYPRPVADLVVDTIRRDGPMTATKLATVMSGDLGFRVPTSTPSAAAAGLVRGGALTILDRKDEGANVYALPEAA
jgi:hypothetical protein